MAKSNKTKALTQHARVAMANQLKLSQLIIVFLLSCCIQSRINTNYQLNKAQFQDKPHSYPGIVNQFKAAVGRCFSRIVIVSILIQQSSFQLSMACSLQLW